MAKKLVRCFEQLEHDPRRNNNIKRLTGKWAGKSRYRVGDWRVIFRVDDGARLVLVLSIANRREVYEQPGLSTADKSHDFNLVVCLQDMVVFFLADQTPV